MKKNTTGCRILDDAGVMPGDPHESSMEICQECSHGKSQTSPWGNCVLDRNEAWDKGPEEERILGMDIEVQCQNCKTLETLTFTREGLGPHPRFVEKLDNIYHIDYNGDICGVCRRLS